MNYGIPEAFEQAEQVLRRVARNIQSAIYEREGNGSTIEKEEFEEQIYQLQLLSLMIANLALDARRHGLGSAVSEVLR